MKVVKYYKYKSSVQDVTEYTYFNTVGTEDTFFSKPTTKIKKKYNEFKKWLKEVKVNNPDVHFDTNKIVFQLEDGTFVGWYDGALMKGVSMRADDYVKPIKLK